MPLRRSVFNVSVLPLLIALLKTAEGPVTADGSVTAVAAGGFGGFGGGGGGGGGCGGGGGGGGSVLLDAMRGVAAAWGSSSHVTHAPM